MLRSTNGTNVCITFDIGEGRITDIESITFRVWCPKNTKEFRITDDAGSSWIVRVVPEKTEKWINITIAPDKNICDGKSFLDFGDENGFLRPLNMGFRFTDATDTTAYIDSTIYVKKPADTDPPVIQYDGDTVIKSTYGQPFSIDIKAFDERDQAYIEPCDYVFSAGALDGRGRLIEGEHTVTVSAIDKVGNKTEKVIPVIVTDGFPAVG